MPTSASNNQIKKWRKLLMGKYRKKEGLFLAEGLRCVEQILDNGFLDVVEILADNSGVIDELSLTNSLPVFQLSDSDFTDVSDTETPQGVIAVCRIPDEVPMDSVISTNGPIIALDAVQDPGNLGTIIRTAAWFGVTAILFGSGCVDPFHPKVVRSTAGATGAIPFLKGDLESLFSQFESPDWQIYLLDGSESAVEIESVSPPGKTILVAGNEANGISPKLFRSNRTPVRIKGHTDSVESLNVAVALGIGLYELTDL
ncbi:MAG: RNA methyltransferase [Balneolaceae bacterium]|nr:RNA methyltransferase [Balneolaceae bacterium]